MFERYIYQPFFNILVGLYEVLGRIFARVGRYGYCRIIFSIIVQLLLFPLRLAGEKSEEEKMKIVARVDEAKRIYSHEPIRMRAEIKTILRANAKEVIATTANLLIGIAIILMLYRIFTTGLEGANFISSTILCPFLIISTSCSWVNTISLILTLPSTSSNHL